MEILLFVSYEFYLGERKTIHNIKTFDVNKKQREERPDSTARESNLIGFKDLFACKPSDNHLYI